MAITFHVVFRVIVLAPFLGYAWDGKVLEHLRKCRLTEAFRRRFSGWEGTKKKPSETLVLIIS